MQNFEIIKKSEIISTTKLPLISIVIPCFNRENLVLDAIESALSQSYPFLEVVVSDNASTDNTLKNCLNLVKNDKRVTVIRNFKNLGPVKNWYNGISVSEGEFINLLFSDDFLHRDFLNILFHNLDDNHAFSLSNYEVGKSPEKTLNLKSFKEEIFIHLSKNLLFRYAFGIDFKFVSPCSALFRKIDISNSLHMSINGDISENSLNTGAGPDLMIFLNTLSKYPFYSYTKNKLVFFRNHKNSFTMGKYKKIVKSCYKETLSKFFRNQKIDLKVAYFLRYIAKILYLIKNILEINNSNSSY